MAREAKDWEVPPEDENEAIGRLFRARFVPVYELSAFHYPEQFMGIFPLEEEEHHYSQDVEGGGPQLPPELYVLILSQLSLLNLFLDVRLTCRSFAQLVEHIAYRHQGRAFVECFPSIAKIVSDQSEPESLDAFLQADPIRLGLFLRDDPRLMIEDERSKLDPRAARSLDELLPLVVENRFPDNAFLSSWCAGDGERVVVRRLRFLLSLLVRKKRTPSQPSDTSSTGETKKRQRTRRESRAYVVNAASYAFAVFYPGSEAQRAQDQRFHILEVPGVDALFGMEIVQYHAVGV